MANASVKTRVLWAVLAVLTLAAGMAVLSILFDGAMGGDERMLVTSVTTVIYALLALVGGLVIARRPRLGWWSLILLGISYLAWIVFIWVDPPWDQQGDYLRVTGFLSVPPGVSLHLGLLMLPTIRGTHWRILRAIAGVCSVVAGLLLIMIFGSDDSSFFWFGGPLTGVLVLLALLGTVMIPVASAIEKSSADDEHDIDIEHRTPVTVTCPRCQESTSIRSNTDSACESCGMRIRVNITEPRCACGYLLYNLTGEVCPECGKPIPSEHRWHTRDSSAQSSGQRP